MKHRCDTARLNASRVLAALAMATAGEAFARTPGQTEDIPSITWTSCAPGTVEDQLSAALGNRIQCGSMLAPLDADAPESGTITVGLIRVKAGKPDERQGSIFFNFGGPGANPLQFLPHTAYLWASRSPDHPIDGDKRRLANRFDLVAVIPRGLRGGTRFTCDTLTGRNGHDPSIYLADWNWAGFVRDARTYANSCDGNPLRQNVGTLQHVRDMEHARLALGEPVMNFVGTSYGSWVGAFYAATYPARTGRIVLDSVMDYSGTLEDQLEALPEHRQALFARNALRPALARPLVYKIGSDPVAVMDRFRAMPHQALEAWASVIGAPAHLVAALTLADWMRSEGDPAGDRLMARAVNHTFSSDPAANLQIRHAALRLSSRLGQPSDPTLDGLIDLSVYHAVVCGDSPWRKDVKALRKTANTIAARYPAANGGPVETGLICASWGAQPRWRPSLTELARAQPLLIIQSEFDPATPYSGAQRAFHASPGAYMVVANGSDVHGLFGMSATPCVEQSVGRFLLTGERPARRLSTCDYVRTPASRQRREVPGEPTVDEVREVLMQRLRQS